MPAEGIIMFIFMSELICGAVFVYFMYNYLSGEYDTN